MNTTDTIEILMTKYLDNCEAIKYLNTSETTLWRLRQSGELPYSKVGTRLLYNRSDLDAFIERHKQGGKLGI